MISQNIAVGTSISIPATSDVPTPQVGQAPIPTSDLVGVAMIISAAAPVLVEWIKSRNSRKRIRFITKVSNDKGGDNKSN